MNLVSYTSQRTDKAANRRPRPRADERSGSRYGTVYRTVPRIRAADRERIVRSLVCLQILYFINIIICACSGHSWIHTHRTRAAALEWRGHKSQPAHDGRLTAAKRFAKRPPGPLVGVAGARPQRRCAGCAVSARIAAGGMKRCVSGGRRSRQVCAVSLRRPLPSTPRG